MINVKNELIEIDNLNIKNINEKKMSLENFIKKYKNEKNIINKNKILFVIQYLLNKNPELKYYYNFTINYNKSNEKIDEFFS